MFDGITPEEPEPHHDDPRQCHVCGCTNYRDVFRDDACAAALDNWLEREFACGQTISWQYRDPMITEYCERSQVRVARTRERRRWLGIF